MKIKQLIGGASLVAAISLVASGAYADGFSDDFSGATVDSNWTVDRYSPSSITTAGGNLNLNLSSADSAANRPAPYGDTFYNYQGIQRAANVSGNWTVDSQIIVNQNELTSQSSATIWARTGNGADESTAGYDIIGLRNTLGNNASFYTFNDVTGVWLDTGIAAGLGNYDVKISDNNGTISYYINSTLVRTDSGPVGGDPNASPYLNNLTTVFAEGYNYGGNYDAEFDDISADSGSANLQSAPDGASTIGMFAGVLGFAFVARKKLSVAHQAAA